MSQPKVPRDVVGNEIRKGDIVSAQLPFLILWKVLDVDLGGIHTTQGISPTRLRLMADVSLTTQPGIPFVHLIKTINPTQQQIVEAIASTLPSMPKG